MPRPLIVLALLGAGLSCAASSPTGPRFPTGATRVLFIGNSLTYHNDVPTMMVDVARLAGDSTLRTHMVAYPDFSLEDHWAEGTARRLLETNRWDFVVMQQGSSALPASQVHLATWSRKFAPLVRAAGAAPVMYQVWPLSSRAFDFPAVYQSYSNAALQIGATLAPAGAAWALLRGQAHPLPLYEPDGLHANIYGAYVASVVLLNRVRGLDPRSLPPTIPGTAADAPTVRRLQAAAATALANLPTQVQPQDVSARALHHAGRTP